MSTLIQIREKVAELSGRYDLVTDYGAGTFTDAGADFFIKGAQDYLDRITETSHDRGEVILALAQGLTTHKYISQRFRFGTYERNTGRRRALRR